MTISTTTRTAGPFTGDGVTTVFPFAFKVFQAADLYVATVDDGGTIVQLTLDSDFSAALNADQNSNPGGSITLLAGGLEVGLALNITSNLSPLQAVALSTNSGFYPDVINDALDLLTMLVQQVLRDESRVIISPYPENADLELPPAALRAGTVIMFDSDGNLQLVPVAGGSSIVPGSQTAAGTVDGSNKDFTFTAPSGPTPSILVFAGGIFQDPATDYGTPVYVSGTTWKITFGTAPANGPIKILMLG